MTFDVDIFKHHFPLFRQAQNHSLVYLDNAATTQKPQCVIDAISHFYTAQNGNAQRASHRLAREATEVIATVRQQAADFVGAASAANIVFTSGATASLNTLAYGLAAYCQAGDEVLLTHSEHHANLLPWQRLANNTQSQLTFFPEKDALPLWQQWPTVVNERTRIISLTAASNVLGNIVDFSIIAEIKKQFPHIIIVLDASQVAAHIPLQAEQWQCDFLVCSAHKFYGPTGVGLLYMPSLWRTKLAPLLLGGEMVVSADLYTSTWATGVERFEAGTSATAALAGLGACLQFWQQQNRVAMLAYEQQLTAYLHQQLEAICTASTPLGLVTQAHNNVGVATLVVRASAGASAHSAGLSLADLAYWLDQYDIAVRVGDHCAQPLWASLQVVHDANKGLRVSLAAYNTRQDIDRLRDAINGFLRSSYNGVSKPGETTRDAVDDVSDLHWQALLSVRSWQQRYKLLLRWGSRISKKEAIRQVANQVQGCESLVWLQHCRVGHRHHFRFDSDSNVIKGLAALLLVWLDGKTTEEINPDEIRACYQELGLARHLSESRMNGFHALLNAALHCIYDRP